MYGIISFAIAIYTVAVVIVSLGIDDIIMRDIMQQPNKQGSIQGTALFIKLITAFVIYIIIITYAILYYESNKLYVLCIIITSVLFQPLSIFSYIFLINAQAKYTSSARIISYTISSIIKVILIIIKAPVIYFAFAIFLDYAVFYIVVVVMYKIKDYNIQSYHIDITYIKYILKKAVPLFSIVLFYTFYQKITIIMISYMYSDYVSGLYSVAIRLTEVWYLVPAVLMTALYPAIINAKKISRDEYNKRIKNIFYITTLPFILISLIVTVLSPFIINLLYGDKYINSSSVLAITIWVIPFITFYTISYKYFILENKLIPLFLRSILSFIILVILNYILGSLYYLKGYSLSLVISAFISFFLIDLFFKETRQLFIIKLSSIFIPCIFFLNLLKKYKNNP